jgi:hypothetical protein
MEQWTTVPATNASVGYKGQLAFDGIYMYFCVSQNKWIKTTAITSF